MPKNYEALANELEALTRKYAVHASEESDLLELADRIRKSDKLLPSSELERTYGQATMGLEGHGYFYMFIKKYKSIEALTNGP